MSQTEMKFEEMIFEIYENGGTPRWQSAKAGKEVYQLHRKECDNEILEFIVWYKNQTGLVKSFLDPSNTMKLFQQSKDYNQ